MVLGVKGMTYILYFWIKRGPLVIGMLAGANSDIQSWLYRRCCPLR